MEVPHPDLLLRQGEDNLQAELTRAQEQELAEMIARDNLSKQQKKAERDANRLARSLKQQAAPTTKKPIQKTAAKPG